MPTIQPDTRTRLALGELTGLLFEGSPSAVSVKRADLTTYEVEASGEAGAFDLTATRCPDLLDVTWTVSGIELKASIEVVSRHVCSTADVLNYRKDQYELASLGFADEDAFEARGSAVSTIEVEAARALQPVVSAFIVDRPCTGRAQIPVLDAAEVVSVEHQDGTAVSVTPAVYPGGFVDMTQLDRGVFYVLRVEHGMRDIAPEARKAVAALAAWGLAPKSAPENATSTSTDAGVLSFVIGGVNGATSIPEVNALISRHGFRKYEVG